MGSDDEREIHAGGLVTGAAGEDSVPILLIPGERVYGPDGELLLVVGSGRENTEEDDSPLRETAGQSQGF